MRRVDKSNPDARDAGHDTVAGAPQTSARFLLIGLTLSAAVAGTLSAIDRWSTIPDDGLVMSAAVIALGCMITLCLLAFLRRAEQRIASNHSIAAAYHDALGAMNQQLREEGEFLRAREQELSQFFSLSLEMLCIVAFDGRFRRINPSFVSTLGHPAEEILGRPFFDFVHPDDIEATQAQMARLSAGQNVLSFTNRYRCSDGSYRWLSWNATPSSNGEVIYAAAMDSTDQKLAEGKLARLNADLERQIASRTAELRRSNQELQQFAFVASHDLREPLRKVRVFSDRLQAKCADLSPSGIDYIERMRSAVSRMEQLLNDLLEFSRVTSKARPFVPVDLQAVLGGVLGDLEVSVRENNAKFIADDLPTVEGDPAQLRQLLQNLLSNALKYHEEGAPPVITILARPITPEGSSEPEAYVLEVIDNGIGFEQRYAERIFNAFERLHGRSDYEGTGMGLAICRKIVDRHQGEIIATSNPGAGARFTITLPVQHHILDEEPPWQRTEMESRSSWPRTTRMIA